MSEEDRVVARAKAMELGYGFIDLDIVTPDSKVLGTLPGSLVESRNVLPIRIEGGSLYLAIFDPADVLALQSVELAVPDLKVVPVLATKDALERAIYRHYGPED